MPLALRIAALICFILLVFGVHTSIALLPLGLALWVASDLFGSANGWPWSRPTA